MMYDEQRITDLEIKFSYQEELLNELNQIVSQQQMIIDKLLKEVRKLNESITPANTENNEKPPHY